MFLVNWTVPNAAYIVSCGLFAELQLIELWEEEMYTVSRMDSGSFMFFSIFSLDGYSEEHIETGKATTILSACRS